MSGELIDRLIAIAEQQESSAHGGNKKCYLIEDYALLSQQFKEDELVKIMQISEELEKKGVRVARTLDYKILEQHRQNWNSEKNIMLSSGYVLQQRAIGEPLLDATNWNQETYQIDYLKQIDSIANEDQKFFSEYVKGWFELQRSGIRPDPSKPGNFIYDKGKGITFIDLDLTKKEPNLKTIIAEQLCVISNTALYFKSSPAVKKVANKSLNAILGKMKTAMLEQGIDLETLDEVIEQRLPQEIIDFVDPTKEPHYSEDKATIERRKREDTRKILYTALKGYGVTDPAELRKIYEGQDMLRVSDEDLEIVLAMISEGGKITPDQVKRDIARAGVSMSDINKSVQEIKKDMTKDDDKTNELKAEEK